ncbi:MAG: GPR endopeptidase [Clostridia bacterium]
MTNDYTNLITETSIMQTTNCKKNVEDRNIFYEEINIIKSTQNFKAGKYVTIFNKADLFPNCVNAKKLTAVLKKILQTFVPNAVKKILVIGLGNENMVVDSLGSAVVSNLKVGKSKKCEIFAFCPSVVTQTGVESYDLVKAIVKIKKPDLIIAIDSLATNNLDKIAKCVQITNSGIQPGGGIKNPKRWLDKKNLGVNVVSIGIPLLIRSEVIINKIFLNLLQKIKGGSIDSIYTAFNQKNAFSGLENTIFTKKGIDFIVVECGKIIADTLNAMFF